MATQRIQPKPARTLAALLLVTLAFYAIMAVAGVWTPRLGLDLRGGTTVTLTATDATGAGSVTADKLAEARSIIQQRVDGLGVGEASVTTQGDEHIVIAAPNVAQEELLELVGTTAQLAFRAVHGVAAVTQPAPTPTASAGSGTSASPSPSATPLPSAAPTPPGFPKPAPSPRPTAPGKEKLTTDKVLAWQPSARDLADFNVFKCGDSFPDVPNQPLIACDREGQAKYLLGPVLIEGTQVKEAAAAPADNQIAWVVNLAFDAAGTDAFFTGTSYLYNQQQPKNQFAIVLDSKVVSAPSPKGPIAGGRAMIEGNFTPASSSQLANILKYGALPLAFDVSQVETVSATLGGEQLTGGIIAGVIGLILVLAYSFIYYRALGLVVVGSLVSAATLTYSIMVLLGESVGFALNLPGIAGVIVAIGLTADSFIIYFERIRDEIREGRSLRTAIETGWRRARSTIVVADMVSVLSAVVLFMLAIGGVKGFAFTLGLTTLIDLAVVFWFTKPLMSLLGRTRFFGEGHKWSGLDPEHMGVSRASLLGRRPRATKPATQEA